MTPPSIAFAIVLLSLTLVNAHLIFPKDFSTTNADVVTGYWEKPIYDVDSWRATSTKNGTLTGRSRYSPFQGCTLTGTREQLLLQSVDWAKPKKDYVYVVNSNHSYIDTLSMTADLIVIGMSNRTKDVFERSVVVLRCAAFRDDFCIQLEEASAFMLPTLENLPSVQTPRNQAAVLQSVDISTDGKWLIILWNYTTILMAERQFDASDNASTPINWKVSQRFTQLSGVVAVSINNRVAVVATITASSNTISLGAYEGALNSSSDLWQFPARSKSWSVFQGPVQSVGLANTEDGTIAGCVGMPNASPQGFLVHSLPFKIVTRPISIPSCGKDTFATAPSSLLRQIREQIYPDSDGDFILFPTPYEGGTAFLSASVFYPAGNGDFEVANIYPNIMISTTMSIPDTLLRAVAGSEYVVAMGTLGTTPTRGTLIATPPGYQRAPIEWHDLLDRPYIAKCPAGFYKKYLGDVSPCLPCPMGTKQPRRGQAECIPCLKDEKCPLGSASPVVSTSDPTSFHFPIPDTNPSLQNTMFWSLTSPNPPYKSLFAALLATLIVLILVFVTMSVLQVFGKASRVIKVLKYVDLFKEPQVHKPTLRLRDQGSLVDYIPYSLALSQDGSIISNTGSSNQQHTETLRPFAQDTSDDSVAVDELKQKLQLTYTLRIYGARTLAIFDNPCDHHYWSPQQIMTSTAGCSPPCNFASNPKVSATMESTNTTWTCEIQLVNNATQFYGTSFSFSHSYLVSSLFFTAAEVTLESSCPNCSLTVPPVAVRSVVHETDSPFWGSFAVSTLASTILREYWSETASEFNREGYVQLSRGAEPALTARASLQNWFTSKQMLPRFIDNTVDQATFWVLQKAQLRARKIDLVVALLLTGVTIHSVLRAVVKIWLKLIEKLSRCRNRWRSKSNGGKLDNASANNSYILLGADDELDHPVQ